MREDCVDPTADSPFTVEPIWVVSAQALVGARVGMFARSCISDFQGGTLGLNPRILDCKATNGIRQGVQHTK